MAEMQQASGPSRHRFQPAQKTCPPPNQRLQRTRMRAPLNRNPLGDTENDRGAK
jgi:hypothetical protein